MPDNMDEFSSIPFGKLGIIALPGCEEIGRKIDHYIVEWQRKAGKRAQNYHCLCRLPKANLFDEGQFSPIWDGRGQSIHFPIRAGL